MWLIGLKTSSSRASKKFGLVIETFYIQSSYVCSLPFHHTKLLLLHNGIVFFFFFIIYRGENWLPTSPNLWHSNCPKIYFLLMKKCRSSIWSWNLSPGIGIENIFSSEKSWNRYRSDFGYHHTSIGKNTLAYIIERTIMVLRRTILIWKRCLFKSKQRSGN